MSDSQEFTVGAQVMAPFHGLCEIVEVQTEEMLGSETLFYSLKPLGDATTLKIPAQQMEQQGVRLLATLEEMEQLLEDPALEDCTDSSEPAHQRMRIWARLLRSGRAGCRKELMLRLDQVEASGGKLSKDETDLREQVRVAFRHEVEAVLDLSPGHAGRLVNESVDLDS